MFAKLVCSLLLLMFANSVLSRLVQLFESQHVYLVPISATKYSLRIHHTDGSMLDEIVEKIGPGDFQLKGRINMLYINANGGHLKSMSLPGAANSMGRKRMLKKLVPRDEQNDATKSSVIT